MITLESNFMNRLFCRAIFTIASVLINASDIPQNGFQ